MVFLLGRGIIVLGISAVAMTVLQLYDGLMAQTPIIPSSWARNYLSHTLLEVVGCSDLEPASPLDLVD